MILPPSRPASWPTDKIWPCVLSIMTNYFVNTTVEVLTDVDITPITKLSQWTFYLTNTIHAPDRNASVDLLIIAETLDGIQLDGSYGKVIAVTENVNSSLVLWLKYRLANTVIVSITGPSIYTYTWFPYNPETCRTNLSLTFLDQCITITNGKWRSGLNLYPNKVPKNFEGCPVIYTTYESEPDVKFDVKKQEFYGREVQLMQIISESLNLTTHYLPPSFWFHFYPSNLSARYLVENGLIDFSFPVVVNSMTIHYGQPLPSHYDQPVVWMLPRARPRNTASNIYSGFPPTMWYQICIALVLTGLVATLMAWSVNSEWSWLNLIAAFVASPVIPCKSTTLTAFIFLFQIYSLHIAWFYQGFLLSNLFNVPMERQIQTAAEAADQGLTAFLLFYMQTYFNHTEHEMWNKILRPDFHNYSWDLAYVYDYIINDSNAYMLANLNMDGYKLRTIYQRNLRSMFLTRPYMNNPVCVFGHPGSPLTQVYKRQMGHAIQAGLFKHFTDLDQYFFDFPEPASTGSVQVLTLETLIGAFYIYAFFIAISSLAFLCELTFYYSNRQCRKFYKRCKKIPQDRKQRVIVHQRNTN